MVDGYDENICDEEEEITALDEADCEVDGNMENCGYEDEMNDMEEEESAEPSDLSTPNVGPTNPTDEPLEAFEQLFTPDIVNHIWSESNRYGEQYLQSHEEHLQTHPKARAHDFLRQSFTLNEIYR